MSSSGVEVKENKPKIIRFNWLKLLIKDRFYGKNHSHGRENARRRKQIANGILTKTNGLIIFLILLLCGCCTIPHVPYKECFGDCMREKGVCEYPCTKEKDQCFYICSHL